MSFSFYHRKESIIHSTRFPLASEEYNKITVRLFSILVLVVAIIAGQKLFIHKTVTKSSVHADHITQTPTPTQPSFSPSATIETPTVSPRATLTSPPESITATPTTVQTDSTNLIYPASHQVSASGPGITLQTNDDPQTVTNWYKNAIKTMGMNATSVIENSVNGDVSNQISASSSSRTLHIQITKSSASQTVSITLSS